MNEEMKYDLRIRASALHNYNPIPEISSVANIQNRMQYVAICMYSASS
jgi:hypothetical protein